MEKFDGFRLRCPIIVILPAIELMKKNRHSVKGLGADDECVRAEGAGFFHMTVDEGPNLGPASVGDQTAQAVGVAVRLYARVMNTFVGKYVFVSPQTVLKRARTRLVRSNVKDQLHEQNNPSV